MSNRCAALVGKHFGKLTVIERAGRDSQNYATWLCRCECGKEKIVSTKHLHGGIKSCGCVTRALNLAGQRFGHWLVVERTENYRDGSAQWLCRCDCGNERIVLAGHLRKGTTKSCGCEKSESTRLPKGEAALNSELGKYKGGAKRRGVEWKLTQMDFDAITKQPCHYCGAAPRTREYYKVMNGQIPRNGIDRIDSEKGYVLDNVVPCCKNCNYAKNTMTKAEFFGWIKQAYKHLVQQGHIE